MSKTAFLPLYIAFFICQIGLAQEYYIDPANGNDKNNGSSISPFLTLSTAVEKASENVESRAIIIKLLPGLYVLNDILTIQSKTEPESDSRYIIEAAIMPDDHDWSPEKMPVIISTSKNNSETQFPHSTGILVARNNVTIRGIKFLGNSNPEVAYYYPISKEDESIGGMEVSQCYFISERNATPIQGAIWAHGPNSKIDHCVFYNCRNAILLFKAVEGFSITHSVIYGANESAIWMGPVDSDFVFTSNVVANCNYFWVRPEDSQPHYEFNNSIITDNEHYTGFYTQQGLIEVTENENFRETNVIKSGDVKLVERFTNEYPKNHLHVEPGSLGENLNAGIFKIKQQ